MMSAILPGTGQLYSGRWRDGVVSFLVNGLFISGIISALNSDSEELAIVLGVVEAGWYTANIYNAVNNVHKTNYKEWESHLRFIEFRFGPPFGNIQAEFGP